MSEPGPSFEWYMMTFRGIRAEDIEDDDFDYYHDEYEIWRDSSGKDKHLMWPRATRMISDYEERIERYAS